jgi:hypothetical protein
LLLAFIALQNIATIFQTVSWSKLKLPVFSHVALTSALGPTCFEWQQQQSLN